MLCGINEIKQKLKALIYISVSEEVKLLCKKDQLLLEEVQSIDKVLRFD